MSMTVAAPRLSAADLATFERDGVLHLPGLLDAGWVERLRAACDRVIARPSEVGHDLTPAGKSGRFFGDYFVWRQDPDFRALALESALPGVAAQLMRSAKVNLIWDHLLVKEPNTPVETVWHHDQPYSWCNGTQNCSFWVALDHVDRESGGVEYIRGSHRWGRWFQPVSFNPDRDFQAGEFEPMPDIEAERDRHDIVLFDTAPGDVVVQHLLTVHHAPGNLSTRRRRAVAVRYAGDDATYAVRQRGPKTPFTIPLQHGDALDSDIFPVVWRAA